jgi:hypothetical protein
VPQTIIFVTCTYRRPGRIAFLRRHIDRLISKIDNYLWLIIEDGEAIDPDVATLIAGLTAIYIPFGPTRDKGNRQRDIAYQVIRMRRIDGIVYNMDDDNLVYPELCRELRKVSRFSIFPVGNLGPTLIERPIVVAGKVIGWSVGAPDRKFPVDMGGFAFPSHVLFDAELPLWQHDGIGGESEFIARFNESVDSIDASLCHFNMTCFVFHNESLDSPALLGS